MLDIKSRIQNSSKALSMDQLDDAYPLMMKVYGYIPFKEFNDMPLNMFWDLYLYALKEHNKQEQFMLTMLKFAGVKNPKFE